MSNGTSWNRITRGPSAPPSKERPMATSVTAPRTESRPGLHVLAILAAATAAAVAVNAAISATAVATGAPAGYGPLTFPAYTLFTVLGIAAGWLGWSVVHRRARAPRRVLTVLVPVVALVSLVPDVMLLLLRFIPDTTVPAVVALMLMHVVVIAVAVPAYALASRTH
jgi:hypothetical protein